MPIPTQISDGDTHLTVRVDSSPRLKKYVRWSVVGGELRLRVPPRMTQRQIAEILEKIKPKVFAIAQRAAPRPDADLEELAQQLNKRYFAGELHWRSIRWVANMEKRLGSCTDGGPTDGDIRISTRLQAWPQYVLEYVVAHEICHRKHPNHSSDFWNYLARYPMTERARGFIEGLAYSDEAITLD